MKDAILRSETVYPERPFQEVLPLGPVLEQQVAHQKEINQEEGSQENQQLVKKPGLVSLQDVLDNRIDAFIGWLAKLTSYKISCQRVQFVIAKSFFQWTFSSIGFFAGKSCSAS